MRKEIIEKAKQEYLELKEFVENYKGTLTELYREFEDAFNYDNDFEFFDLNYGKHINTTISLENGKLNVADVVVIWDGDDFSEDLLVHEQNGMIDFVPYK